MSEEVTPLPAARRLRSLDEFTPLPWHGRRARRRALSVPELLFLAAALFGGGAIGLLL